MPIPRPEFDKWVSPKERAILELLESAPNSAFSFQEIANAVGVSTADALARMSLALTLDDLERQGLVLSKLLSGSMYYAMAQSGSKR